MNKKIIKCIVTSLIVFNCLSLAYKPTVASATATALKHSILYTHKDKSKCFDVFSEENYKYLSSEQKKELNELKKCKNKGDALSEDQQKTLHSLIDCIIKGRLGDKKYEDFKFLTEKKRSTENLTEEENKRLKEYDDIINGTKPTSEDIINQFLR